MDVLGTNDYEMGTFIYLNIGLNILKIFSCDNTYSEKSFFTF